VAGLRQSGTARWERVGTRLSRLWSGWGVAHRAGQRSLADGLRAWGSMPRGRRWRGQRPSCARGRRSESGIGLAGVRGPSKWTRRSSEASGPRLGPRERPFRAQSRLFAPMVIGQVEPPRLGPFPRSGTGPPGGLSGDGCSRAESRAPPNGPDGR
jgi:hypothetical protein